MFAISDLAVPIIAAPMAGGPSTPELVAAAAKAGGFGFLAGGDRSLASLQEQVTALRARSEAPFGVNLMVRGDPAALTPTRAAAVAAYRARLQPWADRYNAVIPNPDPTHRDAWDEKLAWLTSHPVPVVSFIFGCPTAEEVSLLHGAGSAVGVTVTTPDDAEEAERRGANFLIVQGPEAGGHQGTWSVDAEPNALPLMQLLAAVDERVNLPLVAAGGISTGEKIAAALDGGASAVQLGTAFLRSQESGAHPLYKQLLADPAAPETSPTRAFSGRVAWGLRNPLMHELSAVAPAAYPEVNQMTKPIRAGSAKAGDPAALSLWAGTGYRTAQDHPAATIVASLWADAEAARADCA